METGHGWTQELVKVQNSVSMINFFQNNKADTQ